MKIFRCHVRNPSTEYVAPRLNYAKRVPKSGALADKLNIYPIGDESYGTSDIFLLNNGAVLMFSRCCLKLTMITPNKATFRLV
jgi:hypothetical protein